MAKRKFSAKQLAAQRRFAAAARAGSLRKGARLGGARKARKSTPMASRTSRARASIGRAYSSRRQSGVLSFKRMATRGAAGALATYAPMVAGDYGPGLALTAVGIAANDDTTAAMGEVALGAALARGLGGAAGFAPPSGNGLV